MSSLNMLHERVVSQITDSFLAILNSKMSRETVRLFDVRIIFCQMIELDHVICDALRCDHVDFAEL